MRRLLSPRDCFVFFTEGLFYINIFPLCYGFNKLLNCGLLELSFVLALTRLELVSMTKDATEIARGYTSKLRYYKHMLFNMHCF